MKKIFFVIAVVLLGMSSCKKDETTLFMEMERYNNETKMHIDDDNYAVWDDGDAVWVNNATYTIGINGTTATIPNVTNSSNYQAVFPANRAGRFTSSKKGTVKPSIKYPLEQVYRTNSAGAQVFDAPMAAEGTQYLKFRNLGAILALNVTNHTGSTINVKCLEVRSESSKLSGLAYIDNMSSESMSVTFPYGNNCVSLNCGSGVELFNGNSKVFYISLPPIANEHLTVKVYDENYQYTLSQTSNTSTFVRNTIYRIPFEASTANASVYQKPLTGLFSIGGGKQVCFAPGNLRYDDDAATWSFVTPQYTYTQYPSNTFPATSRIWEHFGRSSHTSNYGMLTLTGKTNYQGYFTDWGGAVGNGWRTLTDTEWDYILNNRNNTVTVNGDSQGELLWVRATVDGYAGVILFPDDNVNISGISSPFSNSAVDFSTNSLTVAEWNIFEASGCVFLPAAGSRSGSTFSAVNTTCYYWTATNTNPTSVSNEAEKDAKILSIGSNSYSLKNHSEPGNGRCVRLVKDQY